MSCVRCWCLFQSDRRSLKSRHVRCALPLHIATAAIAPCLPIKRNVCGLRNRIVCWHFLGVIVCLSAVVWTTPSWVESSKPHVSFDSSSRVPDDGTHA